MACDGSIVTRRVEPANIYFGAENVECVTPVAGLTGGEYFEISSILTDYYVWLDLDAGSVDPAPAGRTGIEIDLSTGYTIAEYLSALKIAMEAVQESGDPVFLVDISSDGLSADLGLYEIGAPLSAAGAGTSTFIIENQKIGYGGLLGTTGSGIEVTFENVTLDITANQFGPQLLDQIKQASNASLSADFQEINSALLQNLIARGFGDSLTPSSGTELVGFGTSKNFESSLELGGKLVLNPVRLGQADRSEDLVFWKTIFNPETINYDGGEVRVLAGSFTAFPDFAKDASIRLAAFGDWKQDVRA